MSVGWGRGTWGSGNWNGESVSVSLGTLAITSSLGSTTQVAKANVSPSTQVTTSAIGSVIVHENEVINLPSFSMTSSLGTATTTADANVTPESVSVSASLGNLLVYGQVDTSQTPSFSDIATSQSPNYTSIEAGRDAA